MTEPADAYVHGRFILDFHQRTWNHVMINGSNRKILRVMNHNDPGEFEFFIAFDANHYKKFDKEYRRLASALANSVRHQT